jgi:hypothetical protein
MPTDLEAAWGDLDDAKPTGWFVGQPSSNDPVPNSRKPAPRGRFSIRKLEATIGFEPMNKGFADPRVRPLRHVARSGGAPPPMLSGWLPLEDSNLG